MFEFFFSLSVGDDGIGHPTTPASVITGDTDSVVVESLEPLCGLTTSSDDHQGTLFGMEMCMDFKELFFVIGWWQWP